MGRTPACMLIITMSQTPTMTKEGVKRATGETGATNKHRQAYARPQDYLQGSDLYMYVYIYLFIYIYIHIIYIQFMYVCIYNTHRFKIIKNTPKSPNILKKHI